MTKYKLEMKAYEMELLYLSRFGEKSLGTLNKLKKEIKEKGPEFIIELNEEYQRKFKELDQKAVNVNNEDFLIIYAGYLKKIPELLKFLEEAVEYAEEGRLWPARLSVIRSVPKLEGTLQGMEAILQQCQPLNQKISKTEKYLHTK